MKTDMYFAVVCRQENAGKYFKHPGSVTGPSKDEVVQKAIAIKMKWEGIQTRVNRDVLYKIYVGKIEHEALITPNYTLVEVK